MYTFAYLAHISRFRGIDKFVCYFENKFVYLTLYTLLANSLITGADYIWFYVLLAHKTLALKHDKYNIKHDIN